MALYKRGSIWWMSFSASGVMYRRTTGSRNRKLAETIYAKVVAGIAEGKWLDKARKRPRYTFRELATKYEEHIKLRRRNYAKVAKYIVSYLVARFGDLPLGEFSANHIQELQTDLLSAGKKNSYVNRTIIELKVMISCAVQWDMIDASIKEKARSVKMLPTDNRLRFLSLPEIQRLLVACSETPTGHNGNGREAPHLLPIVTLALNTGMRRGEILNLSWDMIDLVNGFIFLGSKDTKTGQKREVPLNDAAREVLEILSEQRNADVPWVFPSPDNPSHPLTDIKFSWHSALVRAGVKDFHFHDLRHTFASHMVMAGVDLPTVASLLGHSDIKMTMRYAHLAPDHRKAAVNLLHNFRTMAPDADSKNADK